MKKYFTIFYSIILFVLIGTTSQASSVEESETLHKFILRSFSRAYYPKWANKTDVAMTATDSLGLEIQNTYTYVFRMNAGPRPVHRQIDQLMEEAISWIFQTQTGSEISQAFLKSQLKRINFHIHVVKSENTTLDSWTDKKFNIHIFLSKHFFNKAHLIKIITHEFGQMLSKMSIDRLKATINETYGDVEVLRPLLLDLLNSQKFLVMISTMRAFTLESKVMKELNSESDNPPAAIFSCMGLLHRVSFSLNLMHYNFETETLEKSGSRTLNSRDEKFQKFISIFADNDRNKNFCEKLISIELSDTPKSESGSGPRPHIGDPVKMPQVDDTIIGM